MTVTYKKLWYLLIDKKMKKKELQAKAGLTGYVMNQLSKDDTVTTDTLCKICAALGCKIEDIVDFIPEEKNA